MGWAVLRVSFCLLAVSMAIEASAQSTPADPPGLRVINPAIVKETDRRAPVDYGYGPGIRPESRAAASRALAIPPTSAVPNGGAAAGTQGFFGAAVPWPIIGLHAVLLPDGRVMNYGTDENGQQGAQLIYSVWDPAEGTGPSSHMVLPNTTGTDLFCSAQTVLQNGQVLITGGDVTINGVRNYSAQETQIFDPAANTLSQNGAMAFARWYPTIINMPNGDAVILGGRQNYDVAASMPEVFNSNTGWRTLPNATSEAAYGMPDGNWYYPKAFLTPRGKIFVLGNWVDTYMLDTAGAGTITKLAVQASRGDYELPSVMYAPGKVLSLRYDRKVDLVNLSPVTPAITRTADIDQVRYWSNMTVLADGQVLVNGGSAVGNELTGVAYTTQIWNPATGTWSTGAAATKARLYHSIALLLPDGSVLTGAGGAPGPVNNLNSEIYYPSYLYKKNGSGQAAPRPTLLNASAIARTGQTFTATVGTTDTVGRVTMVRTGSVTHSFNPDQRFLRIPFTQSGQQLTLTMPSDPDVALPGYYMLFVFRNGVPSIARIVRVTT